MIGFLIERIADARYSGPEDLILCQDVVARLHSLGIRHGDLNRHNFLISSGRATLIDFDTARRCDSEDELKTEFESLPERLADTSNLGGIEVMDASDDEKTSDRGLG